MTHLSQLIKSVLHVSLMCLINDPKIDQFVHCMAPQDVYFIICLEWRGKRWGGKDPKKLL